MALNPITDLKLGNILQIAFNKGIRIQVSQDFRDFDKVKMVMVKDSLAREIRFMFQNSLSPAAIQYSNPGQKDRPFPKGQQPVLAENTAKLAEANATMEIEHNLWARAQQSPEKFGEPLGVVVDSAMISAKRRMAADFYGDGSGLVFEAASVVDTTGAGGSAAVTVKQTAASLGFIGNVEPYDLLVPYTKDAAATNPTVVGTFYAWRVKSRNRRSGVVVLEAIDSSDSVLNLTASNIVDGLVFYRVGQPVIPDVNPNPNPGDYGSLTGIWPGLESLAAADGRLVHGITMSGVTAGTHYDAGAALLDVDLIHTLLDDIKLNVGRNGYKWDRLSMAPEAQKALITGREADRRFISVQDNTRGVVTFKYQHENDSLETYTSEFIRKDRVWVLPQPKGSDKVLEFHGTDYSPVKGQGMNEWHLKATSAGYVNTMQQFLAAYQTMVCKHPAAIGCLKNFTI